MILFFCVRGYVLMNTKLLPQSPARSPFSHNAGFNSPGKYKVTKASENENIDDALAKRARRDQMSSELSPRTNRFLSPMRGASSVGRVEENNYSIPRFGNSAKVGLNFSSLPNLRQDTQGGMGFPSAPVTRRVAGPLSRRLSAEWSSSSNSDNTDCVAAAAEELSGVGVLVKDDDFSISRQPARPRARMSLQREPDAVLNYWATPVPLSSNEPELVLPSQNELVHLGNGQHCNVYGFTDGNGRSLVIKTLDQYVDNLDVKDQRRGRGTQTYVNKMIDKAFREVELAQLAGIPVVPIENTPEDAKANGRFISPNKAVFNDELDRYVLSSLQDLPKHEQADRLTTIITNVLMSMKRQEVPFWYPDLLPENFTMAGELLDTVSRDVAYTADDFSGQVLGVLDSTGQNGHNIHLTPRHYDQILFAAISVYDHVNSTDSSTFSDDEKDLIPNKLKQLAEFITAIQARYADKCKLEKVTPIVARMRPISIPGSEW